MSQNEEFNFMRNEIANGEYKFNYKELLIKEIEKITQKQLIQFYEDYFINQNSRKIRSIELYKNS